MNDEILCDCGLPADDDLPSAYLGLCYDCYNEAAYELYLEDLAERRAEMEYDDFPEDY